MRSAIGSTLLLGIITTFLAIVLGVLVSSIAYTKAFRIKNRVVDEIEKVETFDSNVDAKLNDLFRDIGYIANPYMNNSKCSNYETKWAPSSGINDTQNVTSIELQNTTSLYHYCVFKLTFGDTGKYYYKVVTFAYLDFPLISSIQFPIYGETKMFYGAEPTKES